MHFGRYGHTAVKICWRLGYLDCGNAWTDIWRICEWSREGEIDDYDTRRTVLASC
jgi:hypothetical protein